MLISIRSQRFIVWWGIVFAVIFGLAFVFLFNMVPPPSPKLSAAQVAHWYAVRHTKIRLGAVIAGWTSAFMLPLFVVIGAQMARQEQGQKPWTILTVSGGVLMSIFLVLPPLFWGVAAFTPARDVQITATMHELGMLTLVIDRFDPRLERAVELVQARRRTILELDQSLLSDRAEYPLDLPAPLRPTRPAVDQPNPEHRARSQQLAGHER